MPIYLEAARQNYLRKFVVNERVIETGICGGRGQAGDVYLSTAGHLCVRWDAWPGETARMGTSVTWGTRRVMERPTLNQAQKKFFCIELENEQAGGDSPSTLGSAYDSLQQAPDDVIIAWCVDDTIKNRESVAHFSQSILALREKYGADTYLLDVMPLES